MIMVISPSKTLDYTINIPYPTFSMPHFLAEAAELVAECRMLSVSDLQQKMKISAALAQLNYDRFQQWQPNFTLANAKQALFSFKGNVYEGLACADFSQQDIDYAQQSLRILSGLYGIIKPLDLIQPYRLEMGTPLRNRMGNNLYHYWQSRLSQYLNAEWGTDTARVLINLASQEYFQALSCKKLNATLIKPIFMDENQQQYKVISFYAKKARGRMARFIIQNHLTDPNDIKAFTLEGYQFNSSASTATEWIFMRSAASKAALCNADN